MHVARLRSLAGRLHPAWGHIAAPGVIAISVGLLTAFMGTAIDVLLVQAAQQPETGMRDLTWFFNDFMKFVAIPAMWAASIAWLVARRKVDLALLFALALLVAPLNMALKDFFERPRPDGPFLILENADGMSFPSAHVMVALTFGGLWALIAPEVLPRRAVWPLRLAVIAVVALTAFSRVWVAAHWPTDVAAGILFGWAFVAAIWLARPLVRDLLALLTAATEWMAGVALDRFHHPRLCSVRVVATAVALAW